MKSYSRHVALFLACAAAVTAAACAPESVLDPSDRPDPPPTEAFDADFSFFDDRTPEPDGATSSWAQALQTVASAASDMAILEVPEALVRAARTAPGSRDGSTWYWPFSTSVDGTQYDGELRGVISGNQYEWDLFVTSLDHSPQLDNYLWGKAFTPPRGFEGLWWLANAAGATDSVVARVNWIRNPDNGVNFAFSASDSAGWTYERSPNATVLTYYVFNIPTKRVTWFFDSGRGSSSTSATSTACWDEDLHDVVC